MTTMVWESQFGNEIHVQCTLVFGGCDIIPNQCDLPLVLNQIHLLLGPSKVDYEEDIANNYSLVLFTRIFQNLRPNCT
jgi:hypothetical protein